MTTEGARNGTFIGLAIRANQRVLFQLFPASCCNSHCLRASPPAYPVSEAFAPMTRWQGSTIPTGLRAFVAPTARYAVGFPSCNASSPYVAVVPGGIVRRADQTCC